MEPMPGSACSIASTTVRSEGMTLIMRSTRSTRSARSTDSAPVAGIQAMPTTTTSKMPQGSRKKRPRKA